MIISSVHSTPPRDVSVTLAALMAARNVQKLQQLSTRPFWDALARDFPTVAATFQPYDEQLKKSENAHQAEWDAFAVAKAHAEHLQNEALAQWLPHATERPHLSGVLDEIAQERASQDAQWGEQNLPSVDSKTADSDPCLLPLKLVAFYGMPHPNDARERCEIAHGNDSVTWAHIAVEELAEAIGADNETDRRAELVQAGAVIAAWIESIDREFTRKNTPADDLEEGEATK